METKGIVACGVAVVLALACTAGAEITVECIGSGCGGTGGPGPDGTEYCYRITLNAGDQMDFFSVGWYDPSGGGELAGAYDAEGNPLPGWSGAQSYGDELWNGGLFTPHGGIAPGPTSTIGTVMAWSGPPLGGTAVYYMSCKYLCDLPAGYWEGMRRAVDMGATVKYQGQVVWDEDWDEPVGMGVGPVHGLAPEPGAAGLLVLGAAAMIRRRRRTA